MVHGEGGSYKTDMGIACEGLPTPCLKALCVVFLLGGLLCCRGIAFNSEFFNTF